MSCPADDTFVDHLEGRLSPAQREELEAHVDRCPDCAALFAELHCRRDTAELVQHDASSATGVAPPRGSVLARGAMIGRYEIRRAIGSGGMGIVYEARDPALDRRVAIKTIRGDAHQPERVSRLRREAQLLAAVDHPAIVPVYDVGVAAGRVYVAMEFVVGMTLSRWRDRSRSTAEIVGVFVQAAEGLAAAHRAGIIHRDFKPGNVMVDEHGRVRILDFGLGARDSGSASPPTDAPGRDASPAREGLTVTGTALGTPGYMSPEQWRGEVGPATDQFAFCVTLFELLYGTRPFARDVAPRGTPAAARPPAVPQSLDAIVRRGLQIETSARFASMDALQAALAQPPTRRRRWAMVGVAGLAIATTALLSGQERCGDRARRIQTAWGPEDRTALTEAFARSAAPLGPVTAPKAVAALDAYAAQWRSAYADACRQTEDPAARDATMACLNTARDGLAAVVDALVEPDAQDIARAVAAVRALDRPTACHDEDRGGWSDDHSQAYAHARALMTTGHYAEAIAAATAALDREPAPVGHQRAAFLLLVGQAHDTTDAAEPARAALESAFFAAQDAGDATREAQAAIVLVRVSAVGLDDAAAAERWRGHAEAAIARLPRPQWLRAALHSSLGGAASHFGDPTRALSHLDQAIAIASDPAVPEAHERLVLYVGNRAKALLELGRAEQSRDDYAQVVETFERTYGDHPNTANALNNYGTATRESGDPGRAIEIHNAALAMLAKVAAPDDPLVARALSNRCIAQYLTQEYGAAIASCQRAVQMRERRFGANNATVATSLASLAIAYRLARRYDEAIETFARAREIFADTIGAGHPTSGVLALNLGQTHIDAGRLEQGMEYLADAERIWLATLGPKHPHILTVRSEQIKALREAGQLDEAERRAQRAVAIGRETQLDAASMAPLHLEWAKVLAALGRGAVARDKARDAAALLEATDADQAAEARRWADSLPEAAP